MLNKLKNIFANKQTVDASQPNTETISVDITEPVIEATLPAPSKEKKPRKQKTSDTTKSSGKMSRKQKTSGTTKSSEKKLSPKEIAVRYYFKCRIGPIKYRQWRIRVGLE